MQARKKSKRIQDCGEDWLARHLNIRMGGGEGRFTQPLPWVSASFPPSFLCLFWEPDSSTMPLLVREPRWSIELPISVGIHMTSTLKISKFRRSFTLWLRSYRDANHDKLRSFRAVTSLLEAEDFYNENWYSCWPLFFSNVYRNIGVILELRKRYFAHASCTWVRHSVPVNAHARRLVQGCALASSMSKSGSSRSFSPILITWSVEIQFWW